MVVGDGFEPSKTWSVDLQSTAFGRSAIPPLARVKGIEPSQSAWKADVLPLNYTRLNALQISLSKSDFDIIHTPFIVVNTILKNLFDTYF